MDSFGPTIATNSRALAKLPRRVQDSDVLMARAPRVRRSRNLAGNLYKRCELGDEQLPHLSVRREKRLIIQNLQIVPHTVEIPGLIVHTSTSSLLRTHPQNMFTNL